MSPVIQNGHASLRRQEIAHLPRILCLHGGGSNSRIFRIQCRTLRSRLSPYFRLVYVDAPFLSPAGPDVGVVYSSMGPFRSWLPPRFGVGPGSGPGVAPISDDPRYNQQIVEAIDGCLEGAMREDDRAGGTGAWVGLLGFSQGAKIASSLLLRQQELLGGGGEEEGWGPFDGGIRFLFGVIMAGPAPLVCLDPDRGLGDIHWSALSSSKVKVPTVQVYGTEDRVLASFKYHLYHCSEPESIRMVEWAGGHQVPVKTKDIGEVVAAILTIWSQTGELR